MRKTWSHSGLPLGRFPCTNSPYRRLFTIQPLAILMTCPSQCRRHCFTNVYTLKIPAHSRTTLFGTARWYQKCVGDNAYGTCSASSPAVRKGSRTHCSTGVCSGHRLYRPQSCQSVYPTQHLGERVGDCWTKVHKLTQHTAGGGRLQSWYHQPNSCGFV